MPKQGELIINGCKNGKLFNMNPLLQAQGVDFFDGDADKFTDKEAQTFRNAIRGKGKLYVLAEQAMVVTQILEGIYKSAKTGKPFYFDKEE
jgi:predicted dehydrogenase